MAATRLLLVLVSSLTLLVTVVTSSSFAEKGHDQDPPATPEDLRLVKATTTQLMIDWARSHDHVAGYEVKVGDAEADKIELVDALAGTTNRSSRYTIDHDRFRYTIDHLECGTAYAISVVAVDGAGNRSTPAAATMATSACVDAGSPAPGALTPSTPDTPLPNADSTAEQDSDTRAQKSDTGEVQQENSDTGRAGSTPVATTSTTPAPSPSVSSSSAASKPPRSGRRQLPATPAPPTDLHMVSATASELSFAWSRSRGRGRKSYEVFVDAVPRGATRRLEYTVDGLTCGASYVVAVLAVDRKGNKSLPATATMPTAACIDTSPPTAPANFRQEFTTTSSAVLAWDASSDNVGVVSYGVYDAGLLVGSTPEPRQALTNLACGTTYSYSVDAADAAGNRSAKVSATVRTAECADDQPPSMPAPVSVVDVSDSTVSIAWPSASDNVGVDHYNVYRDATRVGQTTATTSTVTDLACETSYTLGVVAEDLAGNASGMATTIAQTDPCNDPGSLDAQPPSTPTGIVAASATQTSLGLTWSPSSDNVGVASYIVYQDGTAVGSSAATAYTLGDLDCGTTYLVGIEATDEAGNRSGRAEAYLSTAACSDTTPPTAPASVLLASRTQTSISVIWPAATDNVGVVGYGVYRAGSKLAELAERAYTFAGLSCGTDYTLGVDAYDAAGNRSGITSVLTATSPCPDTTPPSTPTNLVASSVTQTGLELSWTASTDDVGVTGYDIVRNGTQVASVTTTSSTQSGLECGTSYAFSVLAVDAAGNESAPAQLSTPTSTCSPTGPTPTLQGVDGGLGYYSQFSNPLPSSKDFFPIAVWGAYNQTQENMNLDAAAGLNVYVWAGDSNFMSDIRNDGRFYVIQDVGSPNGIGSETAGWLLADEIDMTEGPGACPGAIDAIKNGLPSDGRLRYTNYGKGVTIWGTSGYNGHNDTSSACFVNAQDVTSADLYWFTDPWETGWSLWGRASSYGWTIERMRMLDAMDGKRQPIWGFVETGHPFSDGRSITPAELRAAVWHSLIAGARGIIYFEHSFGGSCSGDHHTIRSNCEGTRPAVVSVDAQIKSLASVLNSPTVTSGFTATSSVKAMAKWDGQNFYVFAGSANNAASTASFSIPCVGNATAAVLDENRTISASNGSFTDQFADGNAIHIYRIDGGSICGLG